MTIRDSWARRWPAWLAWPASHRGQLMLACGLAMAAYGFVALEGTPGTTGRVSLDWVFTHTVMRPDVLLCTGLLTAMGAFLPGRTIPGCRHRVEVKALILGLFVWVSAAWALLSAYAAYAAGATPAVLPWLLAIVAHIATGLSASRPPR